MNDLLVPSPGYGGDDARVVGLVFDGERLQCAECGGWYRHLATHVFMAHGLLSQDYRAEHGLPASVPLVVGEISEVLRAGAAERGTDHLDVWRRPGPEREELVAKLRETKREQADEYWTARLAEAGWRSWFDATAWAQSTGAGWAGIGERLGISWQSAHTAGLRAGAQLRHRSWRFFELAEAYVHEHGNLDYAGGELGQYLSNARAYLRNTGRHTAIATALDGLDPNWRLTAAERVARSIAAGDRFEHPTARRHRLLWEQRLTRAGWASWSDAVVWAARTGGGPAEIADRLGTDNLQVSKSLQQHWHRLADAGEDPHAATTALILAPAAGCAGAVTSDDHSSDGPDLVRTTTDTERIQCMVCGLWLGTLGQHLPVHQLTGTEYKQQFGLSPQARMSGYRPRRPAPPADSRQYWDPVLSSHGFEDLAGAVAWAIQQGKVAPELARHLGVPYARLNRALKAAGLRFPTVGDRMIAEAKQHVAAGGNLSEAPTPEMRAWLDTVRGTLRAGRNSVFATQLDQIDPQWRLSAHQRATVTGRAYVHKRTRTMRAEHTAGLTRAGWESLDDALAWAHQHDAPVSAIAIAMGLPTDRVSAQLNALGYELPRPPKSGGSFRRQLTTITDYLHRHQSVDGLPDELKTWLRRRHDLETTTTGKGAVIPDRWINHLLDHLHPAWRPTTDHKPAAAPPPQAAVTSPPQILDPTWSGRLTEVGWENWNDAVDWAAAQQSGLAAIAKRLGAQKIDILEQLQTWWAHHPDTLSTVPSENQRSLPGRGVHAPCPACRLWFIDVAVHYTAAHPLLPPAPNASATQTATTKPRIRTAKARKKTPTSTARPRRSRRKTAQAPSAKTAASPTALAAAARIATDPWAARLTEAGFADYLDAATWATTTHPNDSLTALANKIQTPKTVLAAALKAHGIYTLFTQT
ncbi:MucR family transcriptional regulator [Tsukamurella pulmonis]|uniref:MucR family transcriptional regulator n=1 Tax=Tsukamurella pulmonis TaxID=47312 RepID=UPI00158682E9|nr:MucR family transcriptional regulator [Tsukamurella pulmonis]